MKNVAVYCRVSTEDQSTEGQRLELERWVGQNGIDPQAVEWFEDQETGTRLDRQNFNRLQSAINAGTIKTVVVWKVDRISRGMLDGMNTVADWAKKKVRVVSVTQQIDVSGIMGQMMAAILFAFGEIEHQYRAERQAIGIKLAKAKGKYKGRKAGTTKGKPDRAKELQGRGLRVEEIATALGTSPRTVHRYLATAAA